MTPDINSSIYARRAILHEQNHENHESLVLGPQLESHVTKFQQTCEIAVDCEQASKALNMMFIESGNYLF